MDLSYREFARRSAADYIETEEIIHRRRRDGRCIVCGERNMSRCGCIGVYLYLDENDGYRLRRNRRSTLPHAIITNVLLEGEIEILLLNGGNSCEIKIPVEAIEDLDIAIRGGMDIDEGEKRVLSAYLTALEHASDLGVKVDE